MRHKISVAMIALNEERNLPRTLDAIKWADEIVVVDAGSLDRTEEICRGYGARFFYEPWQGYTKQWRKAIDLCTNPWVLILGADEVIDQVLAAEIPKAILNPGDIRGFRLTFKHFFLGKWIRHCGWYPQAPIRLVRKDSVIVTEREVHEAFLVKPYQVKPIGKGHVEHYSYHTLSQYLDKFNRYTDLEASEMVKSNSPLSEKDLLKAAKEKYKEMYEIKEGNKDGVHGLVLCTLSALYEFVSIAKYLEKKGEFIRLGDKL